PARTDPAMLDSGPATGGGRQDPAGRLLRQPQRRRLRRHAAGSPGQLHAVQPAQARHDALDARGAGGPVPRREAVLMNFALPEPLLDLQRRVRAFIRAEVLPLEAQEDDEKGLPDDLLASARRKARDAGLWAPQRPAEFGG